MPELPTADDGPGVALAPPRTRPRRVRYERVRMDKLDPEDTWNENDGTVELHFDVDAMIEAARADRLFRQTSASGAER